MKLFNAFICGTMVFAVACGTMEEIKEADKKERFKRPVTYNFRLITLGTEINSVNENRRSYYRVFIDKKEEGRTTTGFESQDRVFDAKLQPGRHFLEIEKWVLDVRTNGYVKLNNIDQPKPNFFYFESNDDRIVLVKLIDNRYERAFFTIEFEMEKNIEPVQD
jgi:hypothetical protein